MGRLENATANHIIAHTKSVFDKYGIPFCEVDSGQEMDEYEFKCFVKDSGFTHFTSSLRYPQSNGLIENDAKIIRLLNKAEASHTDPYLALLNYRASAMKHGFSPAELLFNGKLRRRLPNLVAFDKKHQNYINAYKIYYDKCKQKLYYNKGS